MGEKVVVDPIPNLLRWDDVVEAIVGVDVVVVVLVVLVSFLSSVAVVLLQLLFSSVSSMLMKNSLLSMSTLSWKLST